MNQAQVPQELPPESGVGETTSSEPPSIPRWVQVVAGLVLLPITLLSMVGALSIFGIPKVQASAVLQFFTALICLLCLWAVILAFRLLFGVKGKYGLMGPLALRIVAISAVGLVAASPFSGVWAEQPLRTALLCAIYLAAAVRCWKVASHRSRSVA